MTQLESPNTSLRSLRPLLQWRVWHLWLLGLFVAIALVNIRDQGRGEPALIGLASGGFALYGLIGWIGWLGARRLRARLGATLVLALYLIAMAGLFLVSTYIYLLIEHAYLNGRVEPGWLFGGKL